MKNILFLLTVLFTVNFLSAQTPKTALKFNLNDSGTTYIQATFLNQTWVRFNQSNPGTLVQNSPRDYTFDIGLRRTRIQLLAQITDRVFLYFQFGQNNFNAMFNTNNGNRKLAAFFHDAVGEYRFTKHNELKVGGGLTIANGLSRFSQPSIGTIMTMDVPVFAQSTVDQTDGFSRKLSVYVRGQIWKFDYRFILSDPFPITSSGQSLPTINSNAANFAQRGHQLQGQGYLIYQFFDHESHTTPYMTGTYLGSKKVFNIAVGAIYQPNAMWMTNTAGDTVYQAMRHFAVESFLDIPINKENKSAISAYVGYFNLNYGSNYLRYNGLMNPANGTTLNATNSIVGQGVTYGNAYPMFGTGHTIYSQFGYVLPNTILKTGRLMPYVSATLALYDHLNGLWTDTFNAGVNYFINDHKAKVTLDWQNRPTYEVSNGDIIAGKRMNTVLVQYQIFF